MIKIELDCENWTLTYRDERNTILGEMLHIEPGYRYYPVIDMSGDQGDIVVFEYDSPIGVLASAIQGVGSSLALWLESGKTESSLKSKDMTGD